MKGDTGLPLPMLGGGATCTHFPSLIPSLGAAGDEMQIRAGVCSSLIPQLWKYTESLAGFEARVHVVRHPNDPTTQQACTVYKRQSASDSVH